MPAAQPHRLEGNLREWSPRHVWFLDTETDCIERGDVTDLPLRLWVMREVRRDRPAAHKLRDVWHEGASGAELARILDAGVRTQHVSWLFAHNLGFDLATTRLPQRMLALGWEWAAGTFTGDEPWCVLRKDNRSLTLACSHSHLPSTLARIGEAIGTEKLPRPAWAAPRDDWLRHCWRDVRVLSDAMLAYLDWWDRERLGNLSVTGPRTGWNAWRHKTPPLKVHIDARPEWAAFARAAIYGGRRDVWRVGELHGGPWVELDCVLAHAHLVRDNRLPLRVMSEFQSLSLRHALWRSPSYSAVADCVVHTETPRYPVTTSAGVLYPVGTFATRLAGPELWEAHRRGDLRSVGRGLVVYLGDAMSGWARWLIAELTAAKPSAPAPALLAMKGWSRTVIGKWAARRSELVEELPNESGTSWGIDTGRDDDGHQLTAVHLGDRTRVYSREQDGADTLPVVYAWVASLMRLTLQRLIDELGARSVILCNTDSLIVERAAVIERGADGQPARSSALRDACAELSERLQIPPLAVKGVYNVARVRTPAVAILGEGEQQRRRMATVPHDAQEVGPWVFESSIWPGLAHQLSVGQAERFQLRARRFDVSETMPLRWVRADGRCFPPELAIDDAGDNCVTPPPEAFDGSRQNAALAGMVAKPKP